MHVFFCFVCVFGQKWSSCAIQSSVVTSICLKSSALEELSFNETRRENDACHLDDSLSLSCLVESADPIRRCSMLVMRTGLGALVGVDAWSGRHATCSRRTVKRMFRVWRDCAPEDFAAAFFFFAHVGAFGLAFLVT